MFVEKLTKEDLKELFAKLVCKKYDCQIAQEIDENFIKDLGLEANKVYGQIPNCLKKYMDPKNGGKFFGYSLKSIQRKNDNMVVLFDKISFEAPNQINGYFLDETSFALIIDDFSFSSLPRNLIDDKMEWYRFMCSKFGKVYLSALDSYLYNEKNKKIEKANQKLEENNKKIISELTK